MTNIQQIFVNKPDASIALNGGPVAGRIGAEIRGVQLSDRLSSVTIASSLTLISFSRKCMYW